MARLFNPDPDVVQAAWLYFVLVGMSFGLRAVYLVGSAGLTTAFWLRRTIRRR